jgi:hypothetical protein
MMMSCNKPKFFPFDLYTVLCTIVLHPSPPGPPTVELRFLYHSQRRITVSMTPLDELLARRIDPDLTTHPRDKLTPRRRGSNPPSQPESGRSRMS